MPPPKFSVRHRLSDYPDCTLEIRCACGRSSYPPIRMLVLERGDDTFRRFVAALRCKQCGARPTEAYLVAGFHRRCQGGPESNDWAVALV